MKKRSDNRIARNEKNLRNLSAKMDYICKMNHNLKVPKDGKSDPDGVLTKMKRYIDSNRAVAAMFMIFLNKFLKNYYFRNIELKIFFLQTR